MSSEKTYRIDVRWYGKGSDRSFTREVSATDACEALEWATPGSYRIGEFDRCEISIALSSPAEDMSE